MYCIAYLYDVDLCYWYLLEVKNCVFILVTNAHV